MELTQRWDRGRSHDYLNDDGSDDPRAWTNWGAGQRMEVDATGYSIGMSDFTVPGTWRGRQLCLPGDAGFVMYDVDGASSDSGAMTLRPCLSR